MDVKSFFKLLGVLLVLIPAGLFVDGFVLGNTESRVSFFLIVLTAASIAVGGYVALGKFNKRIKEAKYEFQIITAEARQTSQAVSADISKSLAEARQTVALIALILQILAAIFRPTQRPTGTYHK